MKMLREQSLPLIILIICAHLSSIAEAEIESKVLKIYVANGEDNSDMLVDATAFQTPGGLVFAVNSKSLDENHDNFLSFGLETKNPVDSADHLKVCNLTLKYRIYTIVAFGEDKVIMQWLYENDSSGFAVLHFSDCQLYTVKRDSGDIWDTQIVPGVDNTFSLVAIATGRCASEGYCKMTLDDKANIIKDFTPWIEEQFHDYLNVIVPSPQKDHVIVKIKAKNITIGYISDSKFEIIKKLDRPAQMDYEDSAISRTHDLLTVCYPDHGSTVNCGQFDLNGAEKFEKQLTMDSTMDTNLAVFNLAGGGFFLIDDYCSIDDIHHCDKDRQSCFSVRKVDATGQMLGCKRITCGLQYVPRMHPRKMNFLDYGHGKYCISYPIIRRETPEDTAHVDFNVVCFSNDDLHRYTCD